MPRDHIELTPRVLDLIGADRRGSPRVDQLTPSELEALAAIARGDDAGEPVVRHRAISALAAGAPAEEAVPVLADVVARTDAERTDRVTAARALGVLATPDAQAALLRVAEAEADPRVQQAAFAGLGMFGDAGALDVLRGMSEPDDPYSRNQLVLTRALVAHREGADGPFLPEVSGVDRQPGPADQMVEVSLQPQDEVATAADRAALLGSTYGVPLSERAYGLACGRTAWAVFVNREVDPFAGRTEELFRRPWVMALLARRFPARLGVQMLVLTRPVDDRLRLDVVLTDGDVAYTGEARRADEAVVFALTDVERQGTAPTRLAGTLGPGGVELAEAIVYASRESTRQPIAVQTG